MSVCAACRRSAESAEIPRPPSQVDPLVLEKVEPVLATCEEERPGAVLELAMLYDANDLDELAMRAYDLALALDERELGGPVARVRAHRARVLMELGRLEEALAGLDDAIALAPDHAPLHTRRGGLLLELGRADEARGAFAHALELEPSGVPQRLGLAQTQLFAGDPRAALATLEVIAHERPKERLVHGLLARAARALGDEERAREELALEAGARTSTGEDPWTEEVIARQTGIDHVVLTAGMAIASQDFVRALTLLEPLHARFPGDFRLIEGLARACNAARMHSRALQVLELGRAIHPGRSQLVLQTGIAALGLGRLDEARTHLERAIELNPARGASHALLGEVLLRQGAAAEAEQALLEATRRGELDLRTRKLLVVAQVDAGALSRARATLEKLCADFPDDASSRAKLAEVRAQEQGLAGAREASRDRIESSGAAER